MTIQPYEPGSQVDMGRQIGRALVAKWVAEGKAAAVNGNTAGLWNSIQWAAYHSATLETATALLTGDPTAARWAGEGAPSCGATWDGTACFTCGDTVYYNELIVDREGNPHHAACRGTKREPIKLDGYCCCDDGTDRGDGYCTTCAKELLPF